MSDNTGKKLRDKNMSQFDRDPSTSNPFQNERGDARLNQHTQETAAGKAFSQDAMYKSPFDDEYYNAKYLGFDAGSVTGGIENDSNSYVNELNPHIDIDKLKNQNQSSIAAFGSSMIRLGGKTGLHAIGSIAGTLYGVGKYLSEEDADLNTIIDNDFTRGIDETAKDIDKANSVFVDPTSDIGINSKTFNEVIDAYSFIAGAIVAELGIQTVGNLFTGGGGAATAPTRWLGHLRKIGRMVTGADKVLGGAEGMAKASMQIGKTVDKMSKIKRANDVIKGIGTGVGNFGRRALTTTGYEAGLEARHSYDELMQQGIMELEYSLERSNLSPEEKQAYREQKMKEIEESAKAASYTTFAINTALLGFSNMMQFPKIFGNSYVKFKNMANIARPGLGKAGMKKGVGAWAGRAAGATWRTLKNPATEFMEETLQGATGNFSKNYFEVMMGDRTQSGILAPETNTIAGNVLKSLEETYGSSEGRHEGIIGAIVGGMGVLGLKKHGKGYKPTIHGGVAESYRNEKERWNNTKQAIQQINSRDISEAVTYNKDNAIRTALDTEQQELFLQAENKAAFESVQDNHVYRYTMDRMTKGLDGHIKEDIAEMKDMAQTDIEKYRKTFNKDENFTKEEALKEVEAFEEKVDIYKDAYKKVHKRFNENLLRSDRRTKKLIDVLTYAVATEKVQMKRKDVMVDVLHKKMNGEMTREEIDQFVKTSGKLAKLKKPVEAYKKEKNDQYRKDHFEDPKYLRIKAEIEEARNNEMGGVTGTSYESYKKEIESLKAKRDELKAQGLSDAEIFDIDPKIDFIDDMEAIDKAYQKELDEHEAAHEAKFKPFQHKKSTVVREGDEKRGIVGTKQIEIETEQLNKDLEDSISEEMKAISEPRERMTKKEILEHLEQKQRIIELLNKRHDTSALIDRLDEQFEDTDNQKLFQEITEISDRMMDATKVAAALYGFKEQGWDAYARIAYSELFGDISNAKNLIAGINLLVENGGDSVEIRGMMGELGEMIEQIDEDFEDSLPVLIRKKDPKLFKLIGDSIKEIKEEYDKLKKQLKLETERKEESSQVAKKASENTGSETLENVNKDTEHEKKASERNKKTSDEGGSDTLSRINQKLGGLTEDGFENPEDDGTGVTGNVKNTKEDDDQSEEDERNELRSLFPEITSDDDVNKDTGKTHANSGSKNKTPNKGSKSRRSAITNDERVNSLTIKKDTGFTEKPGNSKFNELLEYVEGKKGFQEKAAVVLKAKDFNPDKHPGFINYLKKLNVYDLYMEGYKLYQTEDAKSEFNKPVDEMNDAVYTFIRYAPASLSFYDKVLSRNNDFDFDTEDLDDPIYTLDRFFAADDIKNKEAMNATKLELFEKEKDVIEAEYAKANEQYEKNSVELTSAKARYLDELTALKDKYLNWDSNALSNFSFRQSMINGMLHKNNPTVKLRIDYVNMGDLQRRSFYSADSDLNENHVSTLSDNFTADKLTVDDIFYYRNRTGSRNFATIDGVSQENMEVDPFPMTDHNEHGVSGHIYFKYVNAAGKAIPLKMNTKKLGEKYTKIILDQLENYFSASNPASYKVTNSGIDFLDKRALGMEEFLGFFLKRKMGKGNKEANLKNVYSVNEFDGRQEVNLFTGGISPINIADKDALEKLRPQLEKALGNMRFFINNDMLVDKKKDQRGTLNREVLAYLLDNKIINHGFEGGTPYNNNSERAITLSRAGAKINRSTITKPPRVNELDKEMKEALVYNAKNKKEIKGEDFINNLINQVQREYDKVYEEYMDATHNKDPQKASANLSPEQQRAIMQVAVENVVETNERKIFKIAEKRPGALRDSNYKQELEFTDKNTTGDKLLKMLHAFKAYASDPKKKFTQNLLDQKANKGAKADALTKFTERTLRPKNISKYKSKEDRKIANVSMAIDSQEALDTLLDHVNYLDKLTRTGQTVHVPHGEDYVNKKGNGDFFHEYKKPVRGETKNKSHYATQLVSVHQDGTPRFSNGRVVGGTVTLTFKQLEKYTDKKSGKEKTKVSFVTKTLLYDQAEGPYNGKLNIITRMPLPFAKSDMSLDKDALNEVYQDLDARERTFKINQLNTLKGVERLTKGSLSELSVLNRNKQGGVIANDKFGIDDDGPAAETPIEDSDSNTKVVDEVSNFDFDNEMYYNEDHQDMFKALLLTAGYVNLVSKDTSPEVMSSIIDNMLKPAFNLSTSNQIMQLFDKYDEKGLIDPLIKEINDSDELGDITLTRDNLNFDTFAKHLAETIENNCS